MLRTLATTAGRSPLKTVTAITSCKAGQRGLDLPAKQQGLFALCLADGYSGRADKNRDNRLEPTELYDYLLAAMAAAAKELGQGAGPRADPARCLGAAIERRGESGDPQTGGLPAAGSHRRESGARGLFGGPGARGQGVGTEIAGRAGAVESNPSTARRPTTRSSRSTRPTPSRSCRRWPWGGSISSSRVTKRAWICWRMRWGGFPP